MQHLLSPRLEASQLVPSQISPQLSVLEEDWFGLWVRYQSSSRSPSPSWTRFPVLAALQKYLTPISNYEDQKRFDEKKSMWAWFRSYALDNPFAVRHLGEAIPVHANCKSCEGWALFNDHCRFLSLLEAHPGEFPVALSSVLEATLVEASRFISDALEGGRLDYLNAIALAIAQAYKLVQGGEYKEAYSIIDAGLTSFRSHQDLFSIKIAVECWNVACLAGPEYMFNQSLGPVEFGRAKALAMDRTVSLGGTTRLDMKCSPDEIQEFSFYFFARGIRRFRVRLAELAEDDDGVEDGEAAEYGDEPVEDEYEERFAELADDDDGAEDGEAAEYGDKSVEDEYESREDECESREDEEEGFATMKMAVILLRKLAMQERKWLIA